MDTTRRDETGPHDRTGHDSEPIETPYRSTNATQLPVTDQARQQLEAVRDEWLMPLVTRIGELERENGRLEAERDTLAKRVAELEAAHATQTHEPAVVDAGAVDDDTPTPETAVNAWQRLRRWLGR